MRTTFLQTLACLFIALSVACHENVDIEPAFTPTQAPNSLENALLYVSSEQTPSRALLLDVAADKPVVRDFELAPGLVQTFVMPGSAGRQVLVFTQGVGATQGKKRMPAQNASLQLFDRTGPILTIPLSGRYGNLAITDDGKFAIAYGASGNLVLQNAIEVISFDKARMPNTPPTFVMDLSFDGRAPTNFVFAPSTGFVRRLAMAPLANALQVIDLEHPERGEISIKLSEQSSLTPTKIVFAADQFFVQNQSSNQILSFQSIEQPRGMQPFQLAPTVLTTTTSVEDLETVGSGDSLRLLALAGDLQVLDPSVGNTVSITGVSSFAQIYKFDGASPVDGTVAPRAALYGAGSAEIGFVDLGNENDWSTRNVELIELGDALVQLLPIAGTHLALVTHSTNRVSLVDLWQRTVKRVLLDSAAATTLLDQTASTLRLWVGGADGSLGNIDLSTLQATEVPLSFSFSSAASTPKDAALPNGQNLLIVPNTSDAARRIAVLQDSALGQVTLLAADAPTPETALELVGFFVAGLFD